MLAPTLVALTFAVVALAELPDKSLLASVLLATRYPPRWVLLGIGTAFCLHVVIAVLAGDALGLLPAPVVAGVVATAFLAGAVVLLRPQRGAGAGAPEPGPRRPAGPVRAAATSFGVVFAGEWGDVTQLAVVNLVARYGDPVSVGVGAALAFLTVATLGVAAGSRLPRRFPLPLLRRLGGLLLVALAALTGAELVRGR